MVFSVSKTGAVKVIHNFGDTNTTGDGNSPESALLRDTDGSLYGVTPANFALGSSGGGGGTVYRVTPSGGYSIVHTFKTASSAGAEGIRPVGGLVKAADGYFYGVTSNGGSGGTLYKMSSTGEVTFLYNFGGFGLGATPSNSQLLLTTAGVIYGTTDNGGRSSYGVLYSYQLPVGPTAPPVISSPAKATGTAGKAFSYQIVASNAPDSFSAGPLPKGLALNTATGLISGAPTVAGAFNVALVAKNAKGAGKLTLNIAIALNTQTISFPALPNQYVGGKVALAATASSGLPITYALVSGHATLSGRVLTFTGTGAITIRATQPGNTVYKAAPNVSTSILVVKKAQAITFGAIPAKVVGTAPFTLTAKTSSGLAIKYTVTGPATISGAKLTITGAGNVRVTANQAGNTVYNAATPVSQRFLVTAK